MARPTAIVVWFDDGTSYQIDPSAVKSIFINEVAATRAGRPGPHQLPTAHGPVKGPLTDSDAPTIEPATTTDSGSCYYVNGIIVCP